MPKRKLRNSNSITNLGEHAQKKPREQLLRTRGAGNKENVPPSTPESFHFEALPSCDSTERISVWSTASFVVSMLQEPEESSALLQHLATYSPVPNVSQPASSFRPPPSVEEACSALKDLKQLIRPPRKHSRGAGHFVADDDRLLSRLWQMQMFLTDYVRSGDSKQWGALSLRTAVRWEKGIHTARSLRTWTRAFLTDRHELPLTPENTWTKSLLEKRPDLKEAIGEHLQSVGKYVRALDIVDFMALPANQVKYGLAKPISLSQAQVWMRHLDYRWTKTPNGQFVDGHERADVVEYRQSRFLPAIADYDHFACQWNKDGTEVSLPDDSPRPRNRRVIYWHHDESVFYAHDRRTRRWVHKSEKAVPRAKGEGASLMVADFVSAEHGWLRSPDGKESARVLFRPGKNRDGYFTHEEILAHATTAIDILSQHYPDEQHVFIFDNAPTHLKRAADALSARKMSLHPTKPGKPVFGVDQMSNDANGNKHKRRVPMADGWFYTRAHRFMDAYRRGLNGKQAAWAAKKYHSHRVLPNNILEELDREGITSED
ncbi:hypothetical protein BD310DRAFT_971300 [Dichomitus squalens]|uniref:Uncharacterized protein n=1 Tax=Dichomitus squalens TaxID=114155 RepID=A0A4V2K685_9APHY|nr:hypothetical protein BD310DRAFT_971300 [Dichomitus squalens]